MSAYGPPPPVSVSENQPPGHPPPPPPHPAGDLASYMWPSAAAPSNQPQQQQHSPHHNKWSPGAGPGSVKEEPKPNMNQQAAAAAAAAAGDMGQAPESPQQQEVGERCKRDTSDDSFSFPVQFQYTSPTGEAAFPSVTSNSATSDLYDTSIMSQVQNYSPSLSSSLGERQTAIFLG